MNNEVIKSPPDARDYPVSAAVDVSGVNIPDEYEVWQPPVENQGGVGNCVAQSLANIMECIAHKYGEEHRDYSVGYIYGMSTYNGHGMIPREACSILLDEGDVLREVWELLVENPICRNNRLKVSEDIKAQARKTAAYIRINGINELKAFMLKYNLPVMLIAPTSAFSEGAEGSHATVCYGWNKDGKLKFTNSWGLFYHDKGRGLCEYADMDEIWGIVPMEKIKLTDIDGRWSKAAIEREIERGNIKGYEDGTFKPTNPITREEAAVMNDRNNTKLEKKLADILGRLEVIEKMI